jgi:hypothetical protein
MRHKASLGQFCGGEPPYGWRLAADGETIEPQVEEQAVISAACVALDAGLSLRRIGEELAARGHLPRRGGKWHPQTVKNVLRARQAA